MRGLTTAACLWSVGCIGLSLGAGFYFGGIMTTLFSLGVLIWFRFLERLLTKNMAYHSITLEVRSEGSMDRLSKIEEVLALYHSKVIRKQSIVVQDNTYTTLEFYLNRSIPLRALKDSIADIEGVSLVA